MKKRHIKIIALFSLIIGCFVNLSTQSNVERNGVLETHAKMDYTNYNFEKNPNKNVLPSALKWSNDGKKDGDPQFDGEGRIEITNGGGSTFPSSNSSYPLGKRALRFTLYENVTAEVSVYTTGNKTFQVNNGSSTYVNEPLVKEAEKIILVKFENVSSSGTTFYFGGNSSGVFISSIEFLSADRVKFDANGGQFADGTSSYRYEKPEAGDTTIKAPANPSRSGYIFKGWSSVPNSSTTVNNFEYGKTYYAVWVSLANIVLYMNEIAITLDLNNNRTKTLQVYSLPDSEIIKYVDVKWESANSKIATVDNNGLVTAVALGTTEIIATVGSARVSCRVSVSQYSSHDLTFFASYEDYKNNEIYTSASVNHGETLGEFSKPQINPGPGYEFVWKADVKNTPDDTKDDVNFDFNSPVNQDVKIYAEKTFMPLANIIEVIVPESSTVIRTSDREYYLSTFKQSMTLSIKYDRDDGRFDLIKDHDFFKSTMNDITWHTSDPSVATVSSKGDVKFLKPGKVEIYASLYDHLKDKYGDSYDRHKIQATAVILSSLDELKDDNGRIIDSSIGIKVEKGRFDVLGDNTEMAIRCIGFISESFYQKIQDAKFRVEAINLQNEVQRVFEYKVTTFSKNIDYTSKTVANNTFKPWSEEGKLGTAYTITNLPSSEFKGTFKVTFMVTVDTGSSVVAANVKEQLFVGV